MLTLVLQRLLVVFGEGARVILDQAGKSVDLLIGCGFSQCVGARVHRLVENAVVRLRVDFERALQVICRHFLLFYQSSENGKLYHVAQMQLSQSGLRLEFQLDLLELEVPKEFAVGWWLADEMVGNVNEADHFEVIVNGQIQCLAITSNQ